MCVAKGVLLALMSYDRSIAVCHPLQYPVLMRRQTSICGSRTMDHFCEVPALLKLSCADTSAYERALSTSGVLNLVLLLSLIAAPYGYFAHALRGGPEARPWPPAPHTSRSWDSSVDLRCSGTWCLVLTTALRGATWRCGWLWSKCSTHWAQAKADHTWLLM
ncbi:Hypothetical predicted protein [Marmota monax]|uniref:G-protein coupled receptors family 1 profile domain-containing protein n=1 Tax=Marmota monax TaxID=9995 RepID=A0A5E4BRI4_MARMO|nr:hypothetical protein GHT09_006702 [Marmota monax]VTJ71660.1 Hypothetical predicted protein [Marmota monax]